MNYFVRVFFPLMTLGFVVGIINTNLGFIPALLLIFIFVSVFLLWDELRRW